jgi:hypothetical protein
MNPVAGKYAQIMLEHRFKSLLEVRDKDMTENQKWQISNISHLYLLKTLFDKRGRQLHQSVHFL